MKLIRKKENPCPWPLLGPFSEAGWVTLQPPHLGSHPSPHSPDSKGQLVTSLLPLLLLRLGDLPVLHCSWRDEKLCLTEPPVFRRQQRWSPPCSGMQERAFDKLLNQAQGTREIWVGRGWGWGWGGDAVSGVCLGIRDTSGEQGRHRNTQYILPARDLGSAHQFAWLNFSQRHQV